jgi:hypothetical protein
VVHQPGIGPGLMPSWLAPRHLRESADLERPAMDQLGVSYQEPASVR